jgi:hypothetical protein
MKDTLKECQFSYLEDIVCNQEDIGQPNYKKKENEKP